MAIRRAEFGDLKVILDLVRELANYEKAPDEVWATLEDYQNAYKNNVFEALVIEVEGNIVGTCIYYLTWSTWKGRMLYLEDFIIRETYRRHGLGQQLFDTFLARARELQCTQVKWQVLDWNTPAIYFYEKNRASIEKGWWNGKIQLLSRPDSNKDNYSH